MRPSLRHCIWIACTAGGLLVACPKKSSGPTPVTDPAQYVNTLMGSGGYSYAYGAAFAGASVPNGMMRVGPDTYGPYLNLSFFHFSGYWAGDNTVLAFSHMHLHGTGAQDYGHLGVLPLASFDPAKLNSSGWPAGIEGFSSTFAKTSEHASPGYYALTLDNGNILSEFTTTTHAAHERYTYPSGTATGTILIDLTHVLTGSVTTTNMTLDAGGQGITGDFQTNGGMSGGYHLYFDIIFKTPFTSYTTWTDANSVATAAASLPAPSSAATGPFSGVALNFDSVATTPIEMQVGLSMVSAAGAAANRAAELPGWDFDANHAAAEASWNAQLRALTVYGGTTAQLTTFYSALHHAFVMPGQYSDDDGQFVYRSPPAKMASGFQFINDISGWDVYRTAVPLYNLIAPNMALNLVQSEYAMAQVDGQFPKWPLAESDSGSMLGSSADVIVSDAYLRGITDFDVMGAYKYLRDAALDATMPMGEGRGGRGVGAADYMMYDYCLPADDTSVSTTCEYSQDDFALGNLAAALGQTADAAILQPRSLGYAHLYDPTSGFLEAHNPDGSIPPETPPFNPGNFNNPEFREADAYQSQFCVQHDIESLAQLWGGNAQLAAGLDTLFQNTMMEREQDLAQIQQEGANLTPLQYPTNLNPVYYFAGNEPDIHYAYLMALAGRPDLTQKWIPWIMQTYFTSAADGLPGNDDGGTMTSWYVWSALGIYPIPGSDQYIVGTPEFLRTDIAVKGGVFSIIADGVSTSNVYVQSAKLNGQALNSVVIHQSDLRAGGSLQLTMGPKASSWAQSN